MKKYLTTSLIALASLGMLSTTVFAQSITVTNVFTFKNNLTIGSVGDDVKQLQMLLNKEASTAVAQAPHAGSAGYETVSFGPATAAAVKVFQKNHGVSATGFVGPLTRMALNDVLSAQHPSLPSIVKIVADTSVAGSATLTAQYNGGGEKPTLWFAYGTTPFSMTIISKEVVADKLSGLTQVTLTGLSGDCYAVAYAKNSLGTIKSDWVRCSK